MRPRRTRLITMTTEAALFRLLAWSSPSYPTGAFSYSHGLEWAVEEGSVKNAAGLIDYVAAVLERGSGWVDAVLFVHAWRTARGLPPAGAIVELEMHGDRAALNGIAALAEIAELAAAFRASAETALESRQQGAAFLHTTRQAWPHPLLDDFSEMQRDRPVAHAVAMAVACAAHRVPLESSLAACLHAVAANLVSAGLRAMPLGQTDGQIAIARLMPVIAGVCERALRASLDDLGTCAPGLELCSLSHETQYTRLFRS
jgi:urease accessory protein